MCPDKEKSGNYVGISRLVARAIEINEEEEEYNGFLKVTANHNGHLAEDINNKPKTAGRGCFRH